MYLFVNIVGLFVFLGIAFAFSKDRKHINWISVLLLITVNIVLAAFFVMSEPGRAAVLAAADGFTSLINASYDGIRFAFADAFDAVPAGLKAALDGDTNVKSFVFFASALLPILVIVPLFDILTYIGFLPFIITWLGKAVAFVTRTPRFEAFFSIEMMFLGNTEAIAASRFVVVKLKKERILTIAMMSMSCVSASLIAVFTQMMPGEYVLTAIPLNVINSLLIATIINPVKISKEENEVPKLYEKGQKKDPFFSFLGNSIIASGKLILIICANVITFVGLTAVIDLLLSLFNPLIYNFINWNLSLESLLGLVMYIPAVLLGMPFGDPLTMHIAEAMGTKLVTSEFVVMGQLSSEVTSWAAHVQCIITVFLTSFANLSTLGVTIGCLKGMISNECNDYVSKNILLLFLSGILVSLMSAGFAGLFAW